MGVWCECSIGTSSCFRVSAAMDLHNFRARGWPVVGRWKEEEFCLRINHRCYVSDWAPYDLDGNLVRVTHDGTYLQLKFPGGNTKVRWHKQLKQDSLGYRLGIRQLVHHRSACEWHGEVIPRIQNNQLENLEVQQRAEHTALHNKERAGEGGGRKPASRAKMKAKRR